MVREKVRNNWMWRYWLKNLSKSFSPLETGTPPPHPWKEHVEGLHLLAKKIIPSETQVLKDEFTGGELQKKQRNFRENIYESLSEMGEKSSSLIFSPVGILTDLQLMESKTNKENGDRILRKVKVRFDEFEGAQGHITDERIVIKRKGNMLTVYRTMFSKNLNGKLVYVTEIIKEVHDEGQEPTEYLHEEKDLKDLIKKGRVIEENDAFDPDMFPDKSVFQLTMLPVAYK